MPRAKQFCEKSILNKAMELFWEEGFHATSIQDLVCHLGINRASLYDTYGGKEALFDKAFSQYRQMATSQLKAIFDNQKSIKTGFRILFEKILDEITSDLCRKGCFVVNTITERIPGNDYIQNTILKHKEAVEAIFVSYVQDGINAGEVSASKDAREIGLMLFTLYNGIRVVSKVDPDSNKLKKVIDSGLMVLD